MASRQPTQIRPPPGSFHFDPCRIRRSIYHRGAPAIKILIPTRKKYYLAIVSRIHLIRSPGSLVLYNDSR